MRIVTEPSVYLLARTGLDAEGLAAYLRSIGIEEEDWFPDPRVSDAENLVEAAGRLCYRSWAPWDPAKPEGTNPNVRKVREGNLTYLRNLIRSGHGAVLEHAYFTFVFRDVSRVFTHELVRHRAGWNYSQESLRYVRLNDLRFWVPGSVRERPDAVELLTSVVEYLEDAQGRLAEMFGIEAMTDFAAKKKLTSMFRRVAPIGLATTIMATGNARAWRTVIKARTEGVAEEEIRLAVGKVAAILKREAPNLFWDMTENEYGEWTFEHEKV